MTQLASCSCGSFLPLGSSACPHCGRARGPKISIFATLPGPVRAAAGVVGGGLLSMTLSACYGAPCAGSRCEEPPWPDSGPDYCADDSMDLDGDGYCLEHDCDETNGAIHAFALDGLGDGVDQNCDGVDGIASDGGLADAGADDAGLADAGADDAGLADAGADDAGLDDAGAGTDAGADAGL